MPRYHDRDHFFKYVTKEVAKLIIKDHKLRWSCPLDFNDPFDHQIAFIEEDRIEAITDLFMERFKGYVWGHDDIQFDPKGPFGPIMIWLKQNREVIRREKIFKHPEALKKRLIESGKRAHAKFNEDTRLSLLQTRVMCLAEDNDNLLMWAHYSASHTGAVLKLNAIDELDVPFLVAKKVRYSSEYPVLATEQEWIDHSLSINRLDFGKREGELIYVKGEDWRYEKEWRISVTSQNYPLSEAIYFQEPPQVFGAVYLGCRMPKEDKEEIMNLANQSLPDLEIWQAIQGKRAYKVEFERLK